MQFADSFKKSIFNISAQNFEQKCLELFDYQFRECAVYNLYCNSLSKNPTNVLEIQQIPFLPIEFFKNHAIKSGTWNEAKTFKSSGTTSDLRSKHLIKDLPFYYAVSKKIFEKEFGPLNEVTILALLPSYQEQGDSSLIEMINHFMSHSSKQSEYLLADKKSLSQTLQNPYKKLLIGVSFALLDLVENRQFSLENTIIMETGGMKGRRKELTRNELHDTLKQGFDQDVIYSEYGMTELFSQAYGKNGQFKFPDWVKVLIRDINDPFMYVGKAKTGGINIIDLANIDSCAFIETKDLGKTDGTYFEVLGRFDNSDVRGCNLMFHRNM